MMDWIDESRMKVQCVPRGEVGVLCKCQCSLLQNESACELGCQLMSQQCTNYPSQNEFPVAIFASLPKTQPHGYGSNDLNGL